MPLKIKLPVILLAALFAAACAGAKKQTAPQPAFAPPAKMEKYPDLTESKKAAEIFYRNLLKGDTTQEERSWLAKVTAENNPVAVYLMGNVFYTGKDYKMAKNILKPSADQGFGPAQLEYAISCMETNCPAVETIAYFMLAQKSKLNDASVPANAAMEILEKRASKKTLDAARARADAIESAYLPEFQRSITSMELVYFSVYLNAMLGYDKDKKEKQKEQKEVANYAQEKKAL